MIQKDALCLMDSNPYGYKKEWKVSKFCDLLNELTAHHQNHCETYRNILKTIGFSTTKKNRLEELPFLPASLFKSLTLSSIPMDDVQRVLNSSGTSRQTRSKIYIDKQTSILQMLALNCIVSDFLGKERLPILIIDYQSTMLDPSKYSARTAAIQGFSLFGKSRAFALNEEMEIDLDKIVEFLAEVKEKPFLIFGFTYIIWNYFLKHLEEAGLKLAFDNAILIHGGGWKRLKDEEVSDELFRDRLNKLTGLKKAHNYYGMVEQTGSIYMQCEQGYLHCSSFSDIFTRRPRDFSLCEFGEPGIIQTMSLLPHSYPGHNLLTEDEGIVFGEDNCLCGRAGKYFKITKRLLNAELKGCGDVNAKD